MTADAAGWRALTPHSVGGAEEPASLLSDALCFLKVLGGECLSQPILTRARAPPQFGLFPTHAIGDVPLDAAEQAGPAQGTTPAILHL